jgi:HD-like signal output (HDOD) protein
MLTCTASNELEVPPLPDVAQRVLGSSADDGESAAELAKLVHRDAGLASALLRTANSAALAGVTPTVSIQQAIARLGMRRVREIALTASLRDGLYAVPEYPELATGIWKRSIATALFAKEVAREQRLNVEVAFLCGLLWRVGGPLVLRALAALDSPGPPAAPEALDLLRDLDRPFTIRAATCWGLPSPLLDFLTDDSADDRSDGAAVASLGERLADLALSSEAEPEALEGDPDIERLNLYPEAVVRLCSRSDEILSELEVTQ